MDSHASRLQFCLARTLALTGNFRRSSDQMDGLPAVPGWALLGECVPSHGGDDVVYVFDHGIMLVGKGRRQAIPYGDILDIAVWPGGCTSDEAEGLTIDCPQPVTVRWTARTGRYLDIYLLHRFLYSVKRLDAKS
jgi:hypothetical protein